MEEKSPAQKIDSIAAGLRKRPLDEMRSFAKPPDDIVFVCDAVCILLNKKTGWDTFKKLAADKSFIHTLQCYDRDKVSVKTLRKLKPYIESPKL